MAELFGGHVVAKYLKEIEEVEAVFSLSGGHIDRIYDGFLEYGVRLIDVRHEQAAAMMAHAWSIYDGNPGVCLVTAGPGFTNTLTGVVNAYQENAPMVVISGRSPLRNQDQGALQEINQVNMIKSTVKWHATCYDIKRIPEYLFNAFRQSVSNRPGPVFLELPPDILNIKVNSAEIIWPKRGGIAPKPGPDPALIKPAADLINDSEKPFIICGSGVGLSKCDTQLQQFIDKTGIPFFLLASGRGIMPDDHPLSLWDGGLMAVITAASQADVVIALGVRFNWLLMYGQTFPQAKLVRIDIDSGEIDRNRASDVGIVGDLGLTLAQLTEAVGKRQHTAWRNYLREAYMPLVQEEINARENPSDPIHPARIIARVREAVGDDALYIIDGGDTSYYGSTILRATKKAGVISSAGGQFGCLGTGIPFALAAKAARPEKTVVVINGDGSFGLNAMEFDTAVRHDLPFVCVVNNDCAWGMIKHGQEICYGDDRVCGSELGVVHYEKIAEALGGYGELVEKDGDIVPAIKRAIKSGKPACINVMADPCVVSPYTQIFVDGLKMEQ
jgi:acetolactate synthase-1/2/3 large subunit